MLSFLNVNRNNVAQAYQELTAEGVVITVPGAGTFVSASIVLANRTELHQVIHEAVRKAYDLGFDTEDITDVFCACIGLSTDHYSGKIIVVKCNDPVIEHLCKKMTVNLHVETEGILIQDIEKDPDAFKGRFDTSRLVVCGFNHVEDLIRIFPAVETKIAAVTLQSDNRVLDFITKVPNGTTVGYVCISQRSAETYYNSALFSGHKRLNRVISGLNNTELLNKIMGECDIVFITNFAYEAIDVNPRPGQQIIKVDITIASDTIDYIKGRLMRNA